jgi:hypothetical protein
VYAAWGFTFSHCLFANCAVVNYPQAGQFHYVIANGRSGKLSGSKNRRLKNN